MINEFPACWVGALHQREHIPADHSFTLCVSVLSSFPHLPTQVSSTKRCRMWQFPGRNFNISKLLKLLTMNYSKTMLILASVLILIFLKNVFVCVFTCVPHANKDKRTICRIVSFHNEGSMDGTQVISLGSKHLYPLNLLSSTMPLFLNNLV